MTRKEIDEYLDREASLIADNIECASQVKWHGDSHREDAVRNIRAGLNRAVAMIIDDTLRQLDR